MKLIKKFNYKKILSLIWDQDGSPFYNAKGMAVGVFSGCFPFFGFQTLLGVFIAKIINGNLVLAALGTWISNPFTYVPLFILNYKVGAILLYNPSNIVINPKLLKDNFLNQGWFIVSRLILGSSLVGLIFGLICGLITFLTYRKIVRNKLK